MAYEDPDDDNDGVCDGYSAVGGTCSVGPDKCSKGAKGNWGATSVFKDFDQDGCRDSSEDASIGCPSSSSARTAIYNAVITWFSYGPKTANNGTSTSSGCSTACHGNTNTFADSSYYQARFYTRLTTGGQGTRMPKGCTPGVNCWNANDALFVKRWVTNCGGAKN